MKIRMTHISGPLDGVIEFNEGDPWPVKEDPAILLSKGTYHFTKGVIGAGSMSVAPFRLENIGSKEVNEVRLDEGGDYKYFIKSNDIIDGVRVVVAEYRPNIS